jgi:hypothetical protein
MRVGPALGIAAIAAEILGGCGLGAHLAPPAELRVVRSAPNLACVDHPLVDAWEERLRTERPRREATQRELTRAAAELAGLEQALAAADVPSGLAVLPVIGDGTTKRLGLAHGRPRADRARLAVAARGAARYLRSLYERYEDWPLALAAYEMGIERLDAAREAAPSADFWQLADGGLLPRSTRDFVPRLLATIRLRDGRVACHHVAPVETAGTGSTAGLPALVEGDKNLTIKSGPKTVSVKRQLTPQSAVALTAGSPPRPVAPDMRITLGFQYSF